MYPKTMFLLAPLTFPKASTQASSDYVGTISVTSSYTYKGITSVTVGGTSITGYTTGSTTNGATITIPASKITGNVVVTVATEKVNTEPDNPDTPDTGTTDEYIVYIGSDDFSDMGYRVQADSATTIGWKGTHSGSSSSATDFIEVTSEDSVWINYVAVVNNSLASGGFYDEDKQLVAPLFWDTFNIDQAANASKKFVTPQTPALISNIETEWNCKIKYVKFIAWSSANNSSGLTTTEARLYTSNTNEDDGGDNGDGEQPTYTSYIGEDVFNVNKFVIQSGATSSTGSASAWATDYIPVSYNDKVWIEYVFCMNTSYSCVGFFNSSKELIGHVNYSDFGLTAATGGGTAAFKTPENPINVSDIAGIDVAYVRFIAWDTSAGGRANTEARIYN